MYIGEKYFIELPYMPLPPTVCVNIYFGIFMSIVGIFVCVYKHNISPQLEWGIGSIVQQCAEFIASNLLLMSVF